MGVNMNKTKVMISGEWQKVMPKAARWRCIVFAVQVLVIIRYSILVVKSGYTRNVVVL